MSPGANLMIMQNNSREEFPTSSGQFDLMGKNSTFKMRCSQSGNNCDIFAQSQQLREQHFSLNSSIGREMHSIQVPMKKMRMKMKGSEPFKFKFLKQDDSLQLRQTCKVAKNLNKEKMQQTISNLFKSQEIVENSKILAYTESYMQEVQIQNKEFHKIDICKKNQDGISFIQSSLIPLINQGLKKTGVSKISFSESQDDFDMKIKNLRDTQDVTKSIYVLDRKHIKESKIPLQVIYNNKVERIRAIEYSQNKPPEPIRFDIEESTKGQKGSKVIRLTCESAPKDYLVQVDFDDPNRPKYFATEIENVKRQQILKRDKPLVFSDFTSKHVNSKEAIKAFILALKETLQLHEIDLGQYLKKAKPSKTFKESQEAQTKFIENLRQNPQFEFYKLKQTEQEHRDPLSHPSFTQAIQKMLESQGLVIKELNEDSDESWLQNQEDESFDSSDGDQLNFNPKTFESLRKFEEKSIISRKTTSYNDSVLESIRSFNKNMTQISPSQLSEEKKLIKDMNLKEYQLKFGLTKPQDFVSLVEAKRIFKKQQKEENRKLTFLRGKPPVNERLIWMVRDFLLATEEIELNQKITWTNSVDSKLISGLSGKHGIKVNKLMKELFKKYQLEIILPNVNYIIKKFQAPIDDFQSKKEYASITNNNDFNYKKKPHLITFRSCGQVVQNMKPLPREIQNMRQRFKSIEQKNNNQKVKLSEPSSNIIANYKKKVKKINRPIKAGAFIHCRSIQESDVDYLVQYTQNDVAVKPSMLSKIKEDTELQRHNRDDAWFDQKSSSDSEENQEMLLKQLTAISKKKQETIEEESSSEKANIKKRPAADSILQKLVNESRKEVEHKFDQTALRQKIVPEKSLFKGRPNFAFLFNNRNEFLNRIMGNPSEWE